MERRLAAILAADVVGFSRLTEADEEGTLARLKALRKELIDPKIAAHHGRIVKLMGDGALVEFASVVGAVNCAAEIQRDIAARNREVPAGERIDFRVGINLGDLIVDGDDLYGDGVNLAARLERLAEPGGICISRAVYNHVKGKVGLAFEDLGERQVKNISQPVRVYRVLLDGAARRGTVRPVARHGCSVLRVAAALAIVVALGVGAWLGPLRTELGTVFTAGPSLALPDKPSIAVLPFDNISGDPAQEYFADGITEDIITDLSKLPALFVIGRNSTFVYKEKAVDIRTVARQLGVKYVLEGSVRRAGDQVRINAQLIDAITGGHLWADRYDGTLADVFGLQDQVTGQIVSALAVNLTPGHQALRTRSLRPIRTGTDSQEAYDAFLRGWAYYRRNTPESFATAIPYFEKALALDPGYGRAHAALAAIYWRAAEEKLRGGHPALWLASLGLGYEDARRKGDHHLQSALEAPTPLAHQVASGLRSLQGRHVEAIAEAERSIQLDPNDPVAHEALARALVYAGEPARSEHAIRAAMRLDPNRAAPYMLWLGLAEFIQGRYEAAVDTLRTVLQENPGEDMALIVRTAALGHLGRTAEARSAYATLNELRERQEAFFERHASAVQAGIDGLLIGPYTLKDVDFWPFADPADRERLRHGLELAGVPAEAPESSSPITVAGATTVDPETAKRLFDQGAVFVDVRSVGRWKLGHIPGARLLDQTTDFTEERLAAVVGRDEPVVIYCEGPKCLRSSEACAKAVSWGFRRVHYLRQGFPGWQAAGYPVTVE